MKLTDEEKEKFVKFMNFKNISDCPTCKFSFNDTTAGLFKIALISYSGNETGPKSTRSLHLKNTLLMISVTCNNCGFVQLFDSRIAFSLT